MKNRLLADVVMRYTADAFPYKNISRERLILFFKKIGTIEQRVVEMDRCASAHWMSPEGDAPPTNEAFIRCVIMRKSIRRRIEIVAKIEKDALALWRKLFKEWTFGGENGHEFVSDDSFHDCYFCGTDYPSHSADCVFVAARKTLEIE